MTIDNLRLEMWELALTVAYVRLGLVPLQRGADGRHIPPQKVLETMPSDEARKAKRKYRKLWRRALARQLKIFEASPKRIRKRKYVHNTVNVGGKWRRATDPFEGKLLDIAALEVGERPSAWARGFRWDEVKRCAELRRELLKVAIEFGLCPARRSM